MANIAVFGCQYSLDKVGCVFSNKEYSSPRASGGSSTHLAGLGLIFDWLEQIEGPEYWIIRKALDLFSDSLM